ncbi:MAG: FAD-dependent oxidoreductase, partial [Holosporales bacterium]
MLDVLSLYTRTGLAALDAQFCDHLKTADTALYNRLLTARAEPAALDAKAEGDLLLALAPHLDDFIAGVFGIRAEVTALQEQHTALAPLYAAKRLFVQRVALKKYKAEEAAGFDGEALRQELGRALKTDITELALARAILSWQEDDAENAAQLDLAARYCAFASINPPADSVLFRHPHKLDAENLVPVESTVRDGVTMYKLPDALLRARYGFDLTDTGFSLAAALDQANYCIWCQHQGKDSCSKGLKDKKTGAFQQNQHKVTLAGCPLEEHISEMNEAKAAGHVIGALGIITINNPMCAGTGHRICNDCMKSCIYQKQEPVNIPAIETRTLDDVLHLPYGFEIYSLLTRWNPLNIRRPLPLKDSGYKVLVAGLGPAGYTLAHHLMNDGHTVVGIDGLKIEPLAPALSGVDAYGARHAFEPIKDITSIYENLGERTPAGFGGVAEYGITVRWNKNYLKVIRLLLERRAQFTMIGGVRFGGTVTVESAFSMGFDHVALCLGAGKPTLIDMDNKLARGVRQASDFLMALQLSGAAKSDSLANLTVRLPIVVIGGGLTAIDTATESLAYYSVQVEKFLTRFEAMDSAAFLASLNAEERVTADEWLDHARQLRAARARGEDTIHLLQAWGGSTLAYRRRLQDAPSYTLNHE